MPSHDDLDEGVRVRLRELFGAVDTARQSISAESAEPPDQATVLRVLSTHLYPALDRKVTDSAAAGAPTWHVAQMTSDLFDSVSLRGPALQPVRDAHKQLKSVLAAARSSYEREADELEEIEARLGRVIPGVVTPLEATLLAQHGETLGKLGDVQAAVGNVAPAVIGPLDATLLAQHGETLGKFGDVQTAIGNVAPAAVTPLAAQHGEILGKLGALDDEMDELEDLLKGLPQQLAGVLLKNLPKIVRDVVIAIKTPVTDGPVVIVPVEFGSLDDLAKANASDYTDTTADRLNFLQGAFNVIDKDKPVPPGLIPPIDNLIVAALSFDDPKKPRPTIIELDAMNTLKNQISPNLQLPAV